MNRKITADWDQLHSDAKSNGDGYAHAANATLKSLKIPYTAADVVALAAVMCADSTSINSYLATELQANSLKEIADGLCAVSDSIRCLETS